MMIQQILMLVIHDSNNIGRKKKAQTTIATQQMMIVARVVNNNNNNINEVNINMMNYTNTPPKTIRVRVRLGFQSSKTTKIASCYYYTF